MLGIRKTVDDAKTEMRLAIAGARDSLKGGAQAILVVALAALATALTALLVVLGGH